LWFEVFFLKIQEKSMQISTSDFRKGLRIEIEGTPYQIIEMTHIQQKRRAVIKTKLRNILSGSIAERTFLSGERVDKPDLEEKEMEYLYSDGDIYNFMDLETYEQISIDNKVIEDVIPYMKENERITVQFYNGSPISADLPQFIEIEIAETDPGFKGDTVTTSFKPAKLVTGGTVMVPLFVSTGDVIRIGTEDFRYVERVKK
jgi:elongation factor P